MISQCIPRHSRVPSKVKANVLAYNGSLPDSQPLVISESQCHSGRHLRRRKLWSSSCFGQLGMGRGDLLAGVTKVQCLLVYTPAMPISPFILTNRPTAGICRHCVGPSESLLHLPQNCPLLRLSDKNKRLQPALDSPPEKRLERERFMLSC